MLFLKYSITFSPFDIFSRGLFSVYLHAEGPTGLHIIHGLLLDDKNVFLAPSLC